MAADWSGRAYGAVVRLLPAPIAGRVLPGLRRQFSEVGVTSVPEAARRLLIGPVNSAGQGSAWARAAERLPDVRAASLMFRGADDVFGFDADHVVPASALVGNARWRSAQREAVLGGFTHVIVESGRHPFEADGDALALVRMLQRRGIRVALLWHGSDIRQPGAHALREPDSPFAHGYPDTEILERIAAANLRLVAEAGAPVFVSTPDLLADLPHAQWIPVVVDPDVWATSRPVLGGERPVVVHAPSRAGIKGSDSIGPAARRLHDEGLIEYREVRGVPASAMPELYASANIVLDQFLLGSYGVAACEALAAGRLVIGHVSDEVRRTVKQSTGETLPIMESRAADIEHVLRAVLDAPRESAQTASLGPSFVRAVHDGTRSAEALAPFLDS